MLAVVGIFGQLPITTMARARLRAPVAVALGLLVMGLAFVPLLLAAASFPVATASVAAWLAAVDLSSAIFLVDTLTLLINLLPIALCCVLLIGGQMLVSPFVSDTVASLSRGRLIGTYFGISSVVQGIGAALGNLAGGAAFDLAHVSGFPGFPWLLMIGVGVGCAASVGLLDRSGVLPRRSISEATAEARQRKEAPAR